MMGQQQRFQYTPEALAVTLLANKCGFSVFDHKPLAGASTLLICACDKCQGEREIKWGDWNRASGKLTCRKCKEAKAAATAPKEPRPENAAIEAAYNALTPTQRIAVDRDLQERATTRLRLGVTQSASDDNRDRIEAIEMAARDSLNWGKPETYEATRRYPQYVSPTLAGAEG